MSRIASACALLGAATSLAACGTPDVAPLRGHEAPLVGSLRAGPPFAVAIEVERGALTVLCTGALIAPRVVLTARHCVQSPGASSPDDRAAMRVHLEDDIALSTAPVEVDEVHVLPGTVPAEGVSDDGDDLALLVIRRGRPDVVPAALDLGHPVRLLGSAVQVVGYGASESLGEGRRHVASAIVREATDRFFLLDPIACPGDSGGPVLSDEGLVVGVVSFGPDACAADATPDAGSFVVNAIAPHRGWIGDVLMGVEGCTADGPEICDGADNDCDGERDEDCAAVGETCASDDACALGLACRTVAGARICTRECDVTSPGSCGAGAICEPSGEASCGGLCAAAGFAGDRPIGAACERSEQCASLACREGACADPCEPDAGMCLRGETCTVSGGDCGSCRGAVRASIGERALGEPCRADDDCASGRCLEGGTCTRSCDDEDDCGTHHHCGEGLCRPGARGDLGDPCASVGDCAEGLECAEGRCASTCASTCSAGFDCVDGHCLSPLAALGEACASGLECTSGVCALGLCSARCDTREPCASGFLCTRAADGRGGLCTPATRAPSGGCAVSPAATRTSRGALSALALLALGLVARRRLSRSTTTTRSERR